MGKLRVRYPEIGEGTDLEETWSGLRIDPNKRRYVVCQDGNIWQRGRSVQLAYLHSPYVIVEADDEEEALQIAAERRTRIVADKLADGLRAGLRDAYQHYRGQHGTSGAEDEALSIENLTGEEFEIVVLNWLRALGVERANTTPRTGDQGADIVFSHAERHVVVQCKRYAGAVGNEAVQQVHAAKAFYRCTEAWVVTTGTFTPAARSLAQRTNVKLVEQATREGVATALLVEG